MVTMQNIKSANIRSVGYDIARRELHILFKSSPNVYVYKSVPQNLHEGLKAAPSSGDYFARNIKNRFSFSIKRQ